MSMISRQKLIEAVKKEYYQFIDDDTDLAHNRAISDVIKVIEFQPPADVPDTNVGEYIDTGCGVEVIHTISQTKAPKHLKFTKDGEIVKDFILCKNSVGKVGYYEQVEGKFYAISEEPYKGVE